MKSDSSNKQIVTEWEENFQFDDLDFCNTNQQDVHISTFEQQRNDLCSLILKDFASDTMLTIEDLRAQLGQCFTCGVSWSEGHVSLDCQECGGYSSDRPCVTCEGACGQMWKRDFSLSHACSKARWVGICLKFPTNIPQLATPANTINVIQPAPQTCGASQFLAQELCVRLENLKTTSA
ncbi:unnamed protein product [Diamesa serratosioi]